AFGILLSIGLALASPITLTPVLTRWFVRRRGKALFFLSTGSMAGIAIMTPLLTSAIQAVGWQATILGFAAVYTLFTVPLALFVIRDNAPPHADQTAEYIASRPAGAQAVPESLTLRQAMYTAPFWKITLGLFACG